MKVCLIRHGETDWNQKNILQGSSDIPLNQTGKLQAMKSGQVLNKGHWDIILSSPLIRAMQTAEIMNEQLHLPIMIMDIFRERNFGKAEGLPLSEYNKMLPNIPGLESRESVTKRVKKGLNQVLKQYAGKNVIIVSHGAVINAILSEVSGGRIGTRKTRLSNACHSNICYESNKWKIIDFNQDAHLYDKMKEK